MENRHFYLQKKPIKRITTEKNKLFYWYDNVNYLTKEEYIFIHHFICISNAFFKKNTCMSLEGLIRYTIDFLNKHDILHKKELFYLKNIVVKAINYGLIEKIVYTSNNEYLLKKDIPNVFNTHRIRTPYLVELEDNEYYLKHIKTKNKNYFLEYDSEKIKTNKYDYLFFSVLQNNPLIIHAFNNFLTLGGFLFDMTEKELSDMFIDKLADNYLNYFIERSDFPCL